MGVNGTTKVFALLGNPVEHTISPFIHSLLYKECKYNGTYNPFLVPKGQLENAINGIIALNLEGVNVTVPYKVEAMKYINEIDLVAKSIGAINTIVRKDNMLKGYNTDWIGLKQACEYNDVLIAGKDIAILGAGGSARAAAFMSYLEGAKSITILNRTVEKAKAIISDLESYNNDKNIQTLKKSFNKTKLSYGKLNEYEKLNNKLIVFQTTSLGMYPEVDRMPIESAEFFNKVDFIVDIIYNPKVTAFMKKGKSHGVKVSNGLGMLFFQAVKAFELWTDIKLRDEQLKRVFRELENYIYTKES